MAGSLVTGAGAPTAVVEVQPGMLVQAVTLVDESGNPVSAGIATALATTTTPVVVSAATAPTLNQVLTATSASAATWQASSSGFANPMTTQGDLIYENATPAPARLAGPTSATKQYLQSTGTGAAPQNPAWGTIAAGDVPTLNQNTTGTALNVTGTVATANGGTGQVTAAAAYNALSPMTTTGDIEYESGTNTAARLAGNTTTTPELLSSTGSGAAATAPAWKSLATLGIAPLASPALSGTPTVPTAAALTSNTQAASTAYADTAVSVLQTAMQRYAAAAGQSGGMIAQGYAGATASFQIAGVTTAPAWTSGYLYGAWIFCIPGAAVNGFVTVLPWTTGALAGTYIAVFSSAGTQLGITADLSATATAGRGIRAALTGFTAVPSDGKIFAVYTNGTAVGGSGPSRMVNQIAAQGQPNSGVSALTVPGAEYQTPTTMPASLTYGASGIPSAPGAWNGASNAFPLMALD